MVFNGVTKSDVAVAMLENTDTHSVLYVHVGDEIARGKVTAITLDSLDYEAGGKVTRVEFGQTLSGGMGILTIPGALASPAAGGTTQPSVGGSTSPNRQLGESVEAYMRRRRAMGL